MSKTILLSKNAEEATEYETGLQLGDDILNILWPEINKSKSNFAMMWRIVGDFYGDFKLEPYELEHLAEEIQQLQGIFQNQIEASIWLEVLRTLTNLGITHNLALFGVAD